VKIPNTKVTSKGIRTNRGGQRAWRAAEIIRKVAFLTLSAFADTAAMLGMDELEFLLKNADQTDRADVLQERARECGD